MLASTPSITSRVLNLVTTMDFSTPSVRAVTFAEITPEVAHPAATKVAALMVENMIEGGTRADAVLCDSAATNVPPEIGKSYRARRFANILLAVLSRLERVPSGILSSRADSLRDLPSRSHRTIATR